MILDYFACDRVAISTNQNQYQNQSQVSQTFKQVGCFYFVYLSVNDDDVNVSSDW